jgi:hypothetical protein
VVVALGVSLLVPPALANAKPQSFPIPATRQAQLSFRGSNGYRIQILVGETVESGQTGLTIRAAHGPVSAEYIDTRKVQLGRDGSLRDRLPGIGHVDLRFEESGSKPLGQELECEGDRGTKRRGTFRGSIVIRGRQGFTTARLHSAPGTIIDAPRKLCVVEGGKPGHEKEPHLTALEALGPDRRLSVSLTVLDAEIGGRASSPLFAASAQSFQHGVFFVSSALVGGEDPAIALANPKTLEGATVTPPAPFTGSAEFHYAARQKATWTGDLSVDLPGLGPTPLAGPEFEASLCVDRHCTPDISGGTSYYGIVTADRLR